MIYPSPIPKGTGLTGRYYTNSSTTYSSPSNFNPTNLAITRVDSVVDVVWTTNSYPITTNGRYTISWVGQVQPEFSETYTFLANTGDGVKLWVNDRLLVDKWVTPEHGGGVAGFNRPAGGCALRHPNGVFQ